MDAILYSFISFESLYFLNIIFIYRCVTGAGGGDEPSSYPPPPCSRSVICKFQNPNQQNSSIRRVMIENI